MEKIEALAKFLEIGESEIMKSDWSENLFITNDGEEYLVCTDEEADDEFYQSEKNLIDDLGLESFSDCARDYILENFCNSEFFDNYMEESNQSYIDDIREELTNNDEFETRLEEEMTENNCKTEEDYLEYMNNQYDDGIGWYKDNFGIKDFCEVATKYANIDWDSVIEWTMQEDGRGNELASYDGIENEFDKYYIYRIN